MENLSSLLSFLGNFSRDFLELTADHLILSNLVLLSVVREQLPGFN